MNKDEMDREVQCDDRVICGLCGGTGSVEYRDALQPRFDEQYQRGVNILVTCPSCGGTGTVIGGLEVKR